MCFVIMGLVACGSLGQNDASRGATGETKKGETGIFLALQSQFNENLNSLITGDQLTLSKAQACIDEIEVKLPATVSCSDVVPQPNVRCENDDDDEGDDSPEIEIKIKGPFVFDLLTGLSTPSLENIQLPEGNYTEIEFEFEDQCGFANNASILLEGNATSNSNTYPFLMELDFDDDLEIENPGQIQILENQANQIFTNLVIERWFDQANWIACIDQGHIQQNGNGFYYIHEDMDSDDECDDIYDDILDGIEDALEFD